MYADALVFATCPDPDEPFLARPLDGLLAVPLPPHLLRVAYLLHDRDYTDAAIEEVLGHIARFKTAQCCPWLDTPEDRNAVESMLPADPAWGSDAWDADTWTTTFDREGDAL